MAEVTRLSNELARYFKRQPGSSGQSVLSPESALMWPRRWSTWVLTCQVSVPARQCLMDYLWHLRF